MIAGEILPQLRQSGEYLSNGGVVKFPDIENQVSGRLRLDMRARPATPDKAT
jgi:hypothetical protein